MVRPWLLLALAFAAPPGDAQRDDPMKSPECRRAMDALQAQEAKALADRPASGAATSRDISSQLETTRRQAARACLGSDAPAMSLHVGPPPAPAPSVTPRPPARPPAPIAPPVRLPDASKPPSVVTACDATGCWTSDGSRLQRLGPGPGLLGPRGPCVVAGLEVRCP